MSWTRIYGFLPLQILNCLLSPTIHQPFTHLLDARAHVKLFQMVNLHRCGTFLSMLLEHKTLVY